MAKQDAYIVAQTFQPAPVQTIQFPLHYLLYAQSGALILEANQQRWTLPPARAALIAANKSVQVTLNQTVQACSALFSPTFVATPPTDLTVFEMSPLARELLFALRPIGVSDALNEYTHLLFKALALEVGRLCQHPSVSMMPVATTAALKQAMVWMADSISEPLQLDDLASLLAISPKTLSRRFQSELGMTWSDTLRRLRMIRAIEELADSEKQITQIALTVGYTSISAFNKTFKEFTGQTPTAFRAGYHL